MEIQNLNVSDLYVSTTNPRFVNTVIDEDQAIIMLVKQDLEKMKSLIKSINNEGFLPIPFYIFDNSKEKIVMDGNRRLSAIKLIKDPNILPDIDQFSELKEICKKTDTIMPNEIPCIIFTEDNNNLWDTLQKLHISDESKLIWSPLAQFTMSQKLGGNKYKYMKTLLHYFDTEDVDKMTLDNADAFNRLFTAMSTRNIKFTNDGKIISDEAEKTIKEKLKKLADMITSKILNTRTNKSIYESKVEQIFLNKDNNKNEELNLKLIVRPSEFYEGQNFEISKLKFLIINGKDTINIEKDSIDQISFITPNGQIENNLDTKIVGDWKINVKTLGENLCAQIKIINKIIPSINFVNAKSYVQIGESEDLRKYISSAYNSFNQDMTKRIKVSANISNGYLAEIVNTTFTGNNKKGTYEFCYSFEDIDGSPISKVYTIEVGDILKEKVSAVSIKSYPFMFENFVNINIDPVVNDLINEIQSLSFSEHAAVISCSVRSVLEITIDCLEKKGYIQHKGSLYECLEETIKHLKTVGANVICNIKKSKFYTSYKGLMNILDTINIPLINSLVNLGAHKSKKLINQTTFEETINKDIVQLLNIINEYIN